jgi:hypothetical protein
MSMNTFDCNCADPTTATPPDPRKHVNYVHGMVLGVDDLIQEFAYHQHQRQWLARDAIGYGTLGGLSVTFESDLKVHVSPGTAVTPRGQLIRVVPEQCAEINSWLDLDDTKNKIQNLGNNFGVYVVLCFRDCKVDDLPVPGEPCRCEDQAMAPSRVLDDFRLELRLEAPVQREEDAIRDFVQWLRQIKRAGTGGSSLDEFLQAIRDAAIDLASPLESPPDFLYGSPPQSLTIPSAQLCEYLSAALKLWVVELRPLWQARWTARVGGGCECHGDETTEAHESEECLLLAALNITLTSGHVASANDVVVDDSRRPFVAHLRMLQEMLLCGPCCGGGGCNDRSFATIFAADDHTLRIWIHHPLPVAFDSNGVQLVIDDAPTAIVSINPVAPGTNVFDLDLAVSPPGAMQRGDRLTLTFDTHSVTESGSQPRTLAEIQATEGWCYPDTENSLVTVRSIVDLSGAIAGPLPSNAMPANEVFGTPGNPGVLASYSRADHIHPMPTLPPIPQPASITPAPESFGATAVIGVAAEYARADHVHPMPSLPPGPQPATLMPVAETPGALGAIGVSIDYARADHVHPMPAGPAVPQPATTLPAVENFGTLGVVGVSALYARADHVHPMPTGPKDVVEHPPGAGDYFIVAAGILNPAGTTVGPTYNKLRVLKPPSPPTGDDTVLLTFDGYAPPSSGVVYIVKGTSFAAQPVAQPVIFHVMRFESEGFFIQFPRENKVSFMIEVSMFFRS